MIRSQLCAIQVLSSSLFHDLEPVLSICRVSASRLSGFTSPNFVITPQSFQLKHMCIGNSVVITLVLCSTPRLPNSRKFLRVIYGRLHIKQWKMINTTDFSLCLTHQYFTFTACWHFSFKLLEHNV